jgi:hypothetical protein
VNVCVFRAPHSPLTRTGCVSQASIVESLASVLLDSFQTSQDTALEFVNKAVQDAEAWDARRRVGPTPLLSTVTGTSAVGGTAGATITAAGAATTAAATTAAATATTGSLQLPKTNGIGGGGMVAALMAAKSASAPAALALAPLKPQATTAPAPLKPQATTAHAPLKPQATTPMSPPAVQYPLNAPFKNPYKTAKPSHYPTMPAPLRYPMPPNSDSFGPRFSAPRLSMQPTLQQSLASSAGGSSSYDSMDSFFQAGKLHSGANRLSMAAIDTMDDPSLDNFADAYAAAAAAYKTGDKRKYKVSERVSE